MTDGRDHDRCELLNAAFGGNQIGKGHGSNTDETRINNEEF
jgi:hypothetical protein